MANNFDKISRRNERDRLEVGAHIEKHLNKAPSMGYSLLVPGRTPLRKSPCKTLRLSSPVQLHENLEEPRASFLSPFTHVPHPLTTFLFLRTPQSRFAGAETPIAGARKFSTVAEISKTSIPERLDFDEWTTYNRLMDRKCFQGLISLLDASQKEFLDIVDTLAHLKDLPQDEPTTGINSYLSMPPTTSRSNSPTLPAGPASSTLEWGFRANVGAADALRRASRAQSTTAGSPPQSPRARPALKSAGTRKALEDSIGKSRKLTIAEPLPEPPSDRDRRPPNVRAVSFFQRENVNVLSSDSRSEVGAPSSTGTRGVPSRGWSRKEPNTVSELAQDRAFQLKASEASPTMFGASAEAPRTARDWQRMLKRVSTLHSKALEEALGQEEKELASIQEPSGGVHRLAKKSPHRDQAPILEDFSKMLHRFQNKRRDAVQLLKGQVRGTGLTPTRMSSDTGAGPPIPGRAALKLPTQSLARQRLAEEALAVLHVGRAHQHVFVSPRPSDVRRGLQTESMCRQ